MLDDVIDWLLMKAFAMLLVFAQPHAARELSFYETKSRQLFLIRVFSKNPPTLFYAFEKAHSFSMVGKGRVVTMWGYIFLPHISEETML